jgi:hypothetical protein
VPKADNPALGPGTAVAAGAVFVGLFCLVLWGDRLLPRAVAEDLGARIWPAGALAPWDRIPRGLPLQAKLLIDPPSRAFMSSYEDQDQLLAALRARAEGRTITPDQAREAANDAPPEPRRAAAAEIARPGGAGLSCYALRFDDRPGHLMVRHGPDEFEIREADLYAWIVSGCAQAVKDDGSTLGPVDLTGRILTAIPDAPRFLAQRRAWMARLDQQRRFDPDRRL